jgi:hypothetical protein
VSGHGRLRPAPSPLADGTVVSLRRVERLRRAPHPVASLDAEVRRSDTTLVEQMADPTVPEVAAGIERDVLRDEPRAAVAA